VFAFPCCVAFQDPLVSDINARVLSREIFRKEETDPKSMKNQIDSREANAALEFAMISNASVRYLDRRRDLKDFWGKFRPSRSGRPVRNSHPVYSISSASRKQNIDEEAAALPLLLPDEACSQDICVQCSKCAALRLRRSCANRVFGGKLVRARSMRKSRGDLIPFFYDCERILSRNIVRNASMKSRMKSKLAPSR
jgi:hypothetical protein